MESSFSAAPSEVVRTEDQEAIGEEVLLQGPSALVEGVGVDGVFREDDGAGLVVGEEAFYADGC